MRRSTLLLLAAALTVPLVGVVVVVRDPETDVPDRRQETPFTTTSLVDLDTTGLTVIRAGFCGDVDPREVSAALSGEPVAESGYENGDEVVLSTEVADIVHEFGCSWTGDNGTEARAWVFAPPVDAERAARLVREAGQGDACEPAPTPAFGAPSVGLVCADATGVRASYRGLFGDAWLTCELTIADPAVEIAELRERAGAWCVGVARGAAGH